MMPMAFFDIDSIRVFLDSPHLLAGWAVVVMACLVALSWDVSKHNREIPSLMRYVWLFTVLYSGPFGLAVYFYSGRKQIANDSLWRRAFRSVSHCYSGCGAGEITGVFIAAGLLSLSNWWIAGITFVLAYVAGFALTVGPLMQEGVGARQAIMDALWAETPSITVMEVVAIGVDLYLSAGATMADVRFWTSLVVSLSLGLIAAYPVNVVLIRMGVKEGMHDPREMAEMAHG